MSFAGDRLVPAVDSNVYNALAAPLRTRVVDVFDVMTRDARAARMLAIDRIVTAHVWRENARPGHCTIASGGGLAAEHDAFDECHHPRGNRRWIHRHLLVTANCI